MASSKVEIASSASPFSCVLRDHNWRDRINRINRENCNNVEPAFQTKIKYFVHDHHLHKNLSDSTPSNNVQDVGEWLIDQEKSTISDKIMQNGQKKRENGTQQNGQKIRNISDEVPQNNSKKIEISPELSDDSSIETNNMGCVSSLVQKWREFADTRHIIKKTTNSDESVLSVTRELTACDSSVSEKFETPYSETFETPLGDDTFLDWDTERVVQSRKSEDGGEIEKLRVADVIKKLKLENVPMGNGNEIKVKEAKRCFTPVISSPPRIRGRKAFHDLLMQLERDRHMELDSLIERRAVSKFSHRGRIQSLLRLRFMRQDAIDKHHRHHHHKQQQQSKAIGPLQHSRSSPTTAPWQPSTCEESTIIDSRQTSSSSPIGTKTKKSEPIAKKQEKSNFKLVVEQNPHRKPAVIDRKHSESLPSEHNRLGQGSTVELLREKFNVLDKIDSAIPRTLGAVTKNYRKSSSTPKQQQEVANPARTSCSSQNSVFQETEEAAISSSDIIKQETRYEVDNTRSLQSRKTSDKPIELELRNNLEKHDQDNSDSSRLEKKYEAEKTCSLESEKISTKSNGLDFNNNLEMGDPKNSSSLRLETRYEVGNNSSLRSEKILTNLKEHGQISSASLRLETGYKVNNSCSKSEKKLPTSSGWDLKSKSEESDQNKLVYLRQKANHEVDQNYQDSCDYSILESGEEWESNGVQSWSKWDEEDINNLNWVRDITRPKSDWENLRQARYRDMLDSDHENKEMRRLLERRSVSTFLTSNLRDTMDQLMLSRVERVPHARETHHEHRLEQFVMSQKLQTQTDTRKEEDEEVEEGRDSNFSDPIRYPSLEQPRSSQSSYPDTQTFLALTNRSSIDMDYMYDLRAYMEKLHQEVSELRETVNICMNMQEKMQYSLKQDVASTIDVSVGRTVQGSTNNITRIRTCCLCYEMQVDSLLYRCGHMCTCFKCAHELQFSTGKCPICRAPIVDVVRAYPDGNFSNPR